MASRTNQRRAKCPFTLYGGGNGLSKNTAIIVKASNDARGVSSEYAWIASRYLGAKPVEQLLTARDDEGKTYDLITVRMLTGAKIVLWFDISTMYEVDMASKGPWNGRWVREPQ